MSPFKLGLSVLWAASWTALPIKMAFALLFIAMGTIHLETMLGIVFLLLLMSPVSVFAYFVLTAGMDVHLGEGVGLPILFLLSIPVDIWALGLVARTTFLERLRVEPPDSLGSSLWVRCALAGAVYIPLLWFVEGQATDIARSVSQSLLDLEFLKHLGVAERISLDLTLWGSVSTIVLCASGGYRLLDGGTIRPVSRESGSARRRRLSGTRLQMGRDARAVGSGVDARSVYGGRGRP